MTKVAMTGKPVALLTDSATVHSKDYCLAWLTVCLTFAISPIRLDKPVKGYRNSDRAFKGVLDGLYNRKDKMAFTMG
jgi:hypothetical protein